MRAGGEQHQDHHPNNRLGDTVPLLRQRYGEKPGLDGGRVVLGLHAFVKGWIVTFGIWSVVTLLVAVADEIASPGSWALTAWGLIVMVSFLIALFVGSPVALLLALILRQVRKQLLHVVAFAVVFAGLTAGAFFMLAPVMQAAFVLAIAAVVGISAGIGRAAIIRNVNP